ncbi:MAG: four helix bundle protein [Candidatus Shapirobacteria bacterium]|nr:four helix bundle protein [Candidatus Shapirobacteria bacterium]
MKKYLQLNDIKAYQTAFCLSNYVWNLVMKWKLFEKNTIGNQFTRSVDSISANIAEGFGRYSKRDKIKFYYYSQGSVKESLDWNEKAKIRKLLKKEEYQHILQELCNLPKELNYLISFTDKKLTI